MPKLGVRELRLRREPTKVLSALWRLRAGNNAKQHGAKRNQESRGLLYTSEMH